MNLKAPAFAVVLLWPSAVIAENALDWVGGDWGVDTIEELSCAINPMRIEVVDKGKTLIISSPNDAENFPASPSWAVNVPVLSVDGPKILIYHTVREEPFFLELSKDRATLKFGPQEFYHSRANDLAFTRCSDAQPPS